MLSVIVSDVKVGESTIAFLRKATEILDKLALTKEEKEQCGYTIDENGRTTWQKEMEVSIPLYDWEFAFLQTKVKEYSNWPIAAASQCFALSDKFDH